MVKCTCNGSADKPALPKAELLELKETVRQTFPKNMGMYECKIVWSKCQTSLSQSWKGSDLQLTPNSQYALTIHMYMHSDNMQHIYFQKYIYIHKNFFPTIIVEP